MNLVPKLTAELENTLIWSLYKASGNTMRLKVSASAKNLNVEGLDRANFLSFLEKPMYVRKSPYLFPWKNV